MAPGTELRILPLGDSITDGFASSDGNGYRIGLQEDLSGSKVLYVGDKRAGTMANNDNAGTSLCSPADLTRGSLPPHRHIEENQQKKFLPPFHYPFSLMKHQETLLTFP